MSTDKQKSFAYLTDTICCGYPSFIISTSSNLTSTCTLPCGEKSSLLEIVLSELKKVMHHEIPKNKCIPRYNIQTSSKWAYLDLWICIDRRDGKPLVLAVILVQIIFFDGHFAHDLVCLHRAVTVIEIEGEEAELPRNVKLELFPKEGWEAEIYEKW